MYQLLVTVILIMSRKGYYTAKVDTNNLSIVKRSVKSLFEDYKRLFNVKINKQQANKSGKQEGLQR